MADEFYPDPWLHDPDYRDKVYPSGIARERPMLTTRFHCASDADNSNNVGHAQTESASDRFNRALRSGHGFRNVGDD